MSRFAKPALVAAALGSLALAPAAIAGQPATADLNPPPPSFYTCMATGDQTICHANRVTVEDPVDTGIVCGTGAAAFDIWDQGTIHQRATRYYNADGNLTRRVNHENWAPAWWSNPLTGDIVPYTQSNTTTTVLAVPGDFGSATETTVGENIYRDPRTGEKVLISAGRQVISDADGSVEFRSGKQPFLDAFVNGDMSVFDDVCAALAA
jgi:hypothetical protein